MLWHKKLNDQHDCLFSGSIAGLNVCEWNTVAQLFTLTWLLGFDGFCYFLEHSCLQIVDFSRLKLLLSGDVEQNPGPPMVNFQIHKIWTPNNPMIFL